MSKVKSKFKYLIFAVVLLIPFIYSFFYLKAYWDPYGNMNNIPIAIVNEDKGDKGKKLASTLIDGQSLGFQQVDKAKAEDGLNNKEYYAVITLPEDFTEKLESASTTEKTQAEIKYSPNQKSNYLASQMINAVMRVVEKSVRSQVSETVVGELSDKLNQVPSELDKISDGTAMLQSGAGQLSSGTSQLASGAAKLHTGTATLNTKYVLFDNGLGSAYAGSTKLSNGLVALNSGLNNLSTGAESLSSSLNTYVAGAEQLAGGIKTLDTSFTTQLTTLASQVAQLQAGIAQAQQIPDEATRTAILTELNNKLNQAYGAIGAIQQLQSNSDYQRLLAGANQLVDTSTYGVTPGQALSAGAGQITSGVAQLQAGATDAASGADTLSQGLAELKANSSIVRSGIETLNSGATTLETGTSTLDAGANSLAQGITTLKNSVDSGSADTREQLKTLDGLSDFTANPVEVKEEDVGQINQYGVSFTPLFISIGLWVGALMCYVVLFYDQEHRFKFLDKKNRGIKQSVAYIGIAAGFGLITAFLLKNLIGFSVNDVALYYFGSVLTAMTFMSIIQCFIALFDDVGKFLALIILVLQLAAAGGTFPIETVDAGFRWLSPLLPMTYSINLFKEGIVSTTEGFAGANIYALVAFMAVSFIITVIRYSVKRKD